MNCYPSRAIQNQVWNIMSRIGDNYFYFKKSLKPIFPICATATTNCCEHLNVWAG